MPVDAKSRAGHDHVANYHPFQFQSLNEDQLELLHGASLEIMARTGMRFFEDEAIALFRKGGADVSDGNLVRVPPHLVEWAIGTAPKSISIYDQMGRRAMSLGRHRSYLGPGSDCSYIYDLESGRRRKAVLQDTIQGVRLIDALANYDFVMSMFLPSDIPEERYERQQMAVMLQESTKPIVFVGMEASSTPYAVEMAEIVAGGLEQLQRYPFVVNYVNVVSALKHNEESVQRLLYAAERNLPSIYAPSKSRGTLAPMTVAGALALGNAGQLAGLVLSQLKREGSPFLRSKPGGDGVDMRSMVAVYSAPDGGPFGWDLAHYYGIPTFGVAGASDAKVFDAQAAAEASLSLFDEILNGANLIHDIGYLDCAMTGCLEYVAFCNEVIGWLRRYFRPLQVSEETLALDLIHEVGPDGTFLNSMHTARHVREDWQPALFDRLDYRRWSEKGGTTLQERANRLVAETIAAHRADPLPKDVVAKLAAVVER